VPTGVPGGRPRVSCSSSLRLGREGDLDPGAGSDMTVASSSGSR
jgi:hypothetical protein